MMAVQSTVGSGKSGRVTKWVTAGLMGVIAMMRKAQILGVHARAGDMGKTNCNGLAQYLTVELQDL
jgi:hypothetical protein